MAEFRTEYAKSGRASCSTCKNAIAQGSLRMAKMEQSPFFDGMIPRWSHFACFFKKPKSIRTTSQIEGFNDVRWDDQEKIRNALGLGESSAAGASGSAMAVDPPPAMSSAVEKHDYKSEYAKSGRSSCTLCSSAIPQGTLRLAKMEQAPNFDGLIPRWSHADCFFKQHGAITDTAHIEGFSEVRWEDQERIRQGLGLASAAAAAPATVATSDPMDIDDTVPALSVDYAKAARGSCKDCDKKFAKGDVRVGKEEQKGSRKSTVWYHKDCFLAKLSDHVGKHVLTVDSFKGAADLTADDRESLVPAPPTAAPAKAAKAAKSRKRKGGASSPDDDATTKKARVEEPPAAAPTLLDILRLQNQQVWKVRDALQSLLTTSHMRDLLEHNHLDSHGGESALLERLSDAMVFGVPQRHDCGGRFRLAEHGYVCTGHVTDWARCDYETPAPPRNAFKPIKGLFTESEELKGMKFTPRDRVFPPPPAVLPAPAPPSADSVANGKAPASAAAPAPSHGKPLDIFKVVLVGKFTRTIAELKADLKALGATTGNTVTK
eukprot:Opistho-2@89480